MDKTHHREERPSHASAQPRTGLAEHLLLRQPAKSTPLKPTTKGTSPKPPATSPAKGKQQSKHGGSFSPQLYIKDQKPLGIKM